MENLVDLTLHATHRLAMPVMTHPGIELMGKTVRQAVSNGTLHYEAMHLLSDRYATCAAPAIMDLTVEAEAFGATPNMPDNEIPTVVGRLVTDADSVRALKVPELTAGRLPEYIKANRLAAKNITDRPVLGSCIGPFSLAGRLYGMSEIMLDIYMQPDVITELLEKCSELILAYARAQKEAGDGGIIMAEPAAGLISNDDCLTFVTPYVKRVVDALQDDSFIVVLHNCGNTGACTQAMLATGARAHHFGDKIDMLAALEQLPRDVIGMGNLSPVTVFRMGNAGEVKKATLELLRRTADYNNFIISSGCDTPPHSPIENFDAFFEAVQEFNKEG